MYVGLDLGHEAVRVVALKRSLRNESVCFRRESALEPGAGLAAAAATGAALLQLVPKADGPVRVVCGFDTRLAFLRRLRFPFSSASKVRMVLGAELEQHLALTSDEFVPQMLFSSAAPGGGQDVLAAALPQHTLDELTEALTGAGVRAHGLDLRAGALNTLAARCAGNLPDKLAVLELDGGRALCVVRGGGVPLGIRPLRAMRQLTPQALAEEVEMSLAQAWEHEAESEAGLEGLLLVGSQAGNPAHAEELKRRLGCPVYGLRDLELPEETTGGKLEPGYAAALGLAMQAGVNLSKASGLGQPAMNFCPGRGAGFGGLEVVLAFWPWLLAAAAALVLGLGLDVGMRRHVAVSRLEAIDTQLVQAAKQVAPGVSSSMPRVQLLSIVRNRAREGGPDQENLGRPGSGFDLLVQISQAIPPSLPVTLSVFAADANAARLSGSAGGFGTVEELKTILQGLAVFDDIVIRGVTSGPNGVLFQMECLRADRARRSGS